MPERDSQQGLTPKVTPKMVLDVRALSAAAASHILAESLAPPPEMAAMFSGMAERVNAVVAASLGNYQAGLVGMAAQIGRQVQEQARRMAELMPQLEEWRREEAELYAILVPRGWLISPEVTVSLTALLLKVRREKGVRAMDDLLIRAYNADFCVERLRSTYHRPAFRAWRRTFEMALGAHARGEFPLAVPVWLAAVEGLLREEVGTPRAFNHPSPKKARALSEKVTPAGQPRDSWSDAWADVISGLGASHPPGKGSAALSRHAVLHGSRPRMGGERDSIQGILLIHLLHYFLEQRDLADAKRA